jgi:radical SAM superfamily enzyme YgiQ (UPF0313 family)
MRYKRVLLIFGYGQYYGSNLPLSLGYLAEALEGNNIESIIFDVNLYNSENKLFKIIKDFSPDLVGISISTSIMYLKNYRLIKKIKERFDLPIMAGGIHIRVTKESIMHECGALDFAMLGDGEESLVEFCCGKNLNETKGLYFRENGEIKFSGERIYSKNLDAIAFPRYKGFTMAYKRKKVSLYNPDIYKIGRMSVLTSRGCPYNCIYCSNADHGQSFRFRSPVNVVDEIEYWAKVGYRKFAIEDANFTQKRERVISICDELKNRGLNNLEFSVGPRPDLVDYELLLKMKSVGVNRIFLNFEGSNDKTLKSLNRQCTLESVKKGIEAAFKVGMKVQTHFLLGIPGQTWDDAKDMFRLCERYHFDSLNFLCLTPIPKTWLFDWVTKNNLLFYEPKEYLNSKKVWGAIHYETKDLSKREIQKAMRIGFSYRDRYFKEEKERQYSKFGKVISKIISGILTFRMRAFRKTRRILANMKLVYL